jgi:hypothetical protein
MSWFFGKLDAEETIEMAEIKLTETDEEFNAGMTVITSEVRNANKSQAKPIESSKEVFGMLFSPTSQEVSCNDLPPHQANTGDQLFDSSVPDDDWVSS